MPFPGPAGSSSPGRCAVAWIPRPGPAPDGAAGLRVPAEPPDLRDYLELALRGGFPDVLGRTETR